MTEETAANNEDVDAQEFNTEHKLIGVKGVEVIQDDKPVVLMALPQIDQKKTNESSVLEVAEEEEGEVHAKISANLTS